MDIINNWEEIRVHFKKSFQSNFHVSIASITSENMPTVTPIGSLFLNDDQSGFYFERFPTKLPMYSKINKKICALAVNSNRWFWINSLFKGKFNAYPGIKLYGELGLIREASKSEIKRLNRRMKMTKRLKGHKYLWGSMTMVRELSFTKAEKINLGEMTK
jgi:hypothetical protein